MQLKIYTIFSICILSAAATVRYDNFTLYSIIPKNLDEVNLLLELQNKHLNEYDFWTYPKGIGMRVDILVSPNEKDNIKKLVEKYDTQIEILMENIQEQIDSEAKINEANLKIKNGDMSWDKYYRIDEIYDWLRTLAIEYPRVVTLIEGGRSYEGRQILGAKLSFRPGNERRGVWLDSLIHAREWISGATNTFILNELLTSTDPAVRLVAENHDWYIFPVINPDGYEYSHTNTRLWRKTRTPYSSGCYGADPNRNWGYEWNTGGASNNPCTEIYAGPRAFSEIETESLASYMSTIGHNLIAYITFHSYSQLFLIPYGYTPVHLENFEQVRNIGLKGAQVLARRYGTRYEVGNSAEILYVASGGSDDWAKGFLRIPFALTIELRDRGNNGFLLPASQIIPSGLETLDSLVTMVQEVDQLLLNATVQ